MDERIWPLAVKAFFEASGIDPDEVIEVVKDGRLIQQTQRERFEPALRAALWAEDWALGA